MSPGEQREHRGAGWTRGCGEPPVPTAWPRHRLRPWAVPGGSGAGTGAGRGSRTPGPVVGSVGSVGASCKLQSRRLVRGESALISRPPSCSEGANGPSLQPSREGNLSPPFHPALTWGAAGAVQPCPGGTGHSLVSAQPPGWLPMARAPRCPGLPLPCPRIHGESLALQWGGWKGLEGREGANGPPSAHGVMPGQGRAAAGCLPCRRDAPAVPGACGCR